MHMHVHQARKMIGGIFKVRTYSNKSDDARGQRRTPQVEPKQLTSF